MLTRARAWSWPMNRAPAQSAPRLSELCRTMKLTLCKGSAPLTCAAIGPMAYDMDLLSDISRSSLLRV